MLRTCTILSSSSLLSLLLVGPLTCCHCLTVHRTIMCHTSHNKVLLWNKNVRNTHRNMIPEDAIDSVLQNALSRAVSTLSKKESFDDSSDKNMSTECWYICSLQSFSTLTYIHTYILLLIRIGFQIRIHVFIP